MVPTPDPHQPTSASLRDPVRRDKLLGSHTSRASSFSSFDTADQAIVPILVADELQLPKSTSTVDTLSSYVVPSATSPSITLSHRLVLSEIVSNLDTTFGSCHRLHDRFQSLHFVLTETGTHGISTLAPELDGEIATLEFKHSFSCSSVDDLFHLDT